MCLPGKPQWWAGPRDRDVPPRQYLNGGPVLGTAMCLPGKPQWWAGPRDRDVPPRQYLNGGLVIRAEE